jgi:MtN3 and saliva related transmembrane protein
MSDYSQWVGIFAGVCTGTALVPQLVKIVKEKKAENISYLMLGILLAGLIGWIGYGVLKKDLPIIITNAFSFLVNVLIIIFSVRYKR